MDPISTFALACNVTQLVQQAIGVIIACKKLHEEGSLDGNNEIEDYAENIAALNEDVKAALQKNTTSSSGTKLLGVAKTASETAAELKIELNKLKLSKKQGVRGTGLAFKVALRNLYNRRALDRLQKRLEQQDAVLQSGLLKRLYADFSLNQSEQQANYQKLSQGQNDIIAQVLKTNQSILINIDNSVKASEQKVIAHFDQDASRVRLLDALAFPEMNERHHMIEDRVSDFALTYDWLFKERSSDSDLDASDSVSKHALQSRKRTKTQHDFVEWLRTGADPFWISGKPGSGKSTLMACIYRNLQEGKTGHGYLKAWAGTKSVQFLSFCFFRPASSHLLKSLQGFLRSLCFQILNVDTSILRNLRQNLDGKAPSSLRSYLESSSVRPQSWTNSELKTWLKYLFEHSEFVYCLVVDGLDEVERPESREHVLEAVQWLSKCSTNIKICCSSRPENPFKRVLEQSRFLKLQDFNFGDIKKACHQRLASTRAAQFADKIAYRAEGVFLWAHMVAEDLRAAADRGDDDTDMEMRLEECPTEMNDLFRLILERMDKFYMKRPGPYLRLIDSATKAMAYVEDDISLLELLLASRDQEDLISRVPDKFDQNFCSQLNKECLNLETNIVARCGGLVHIIHRVPNHHQFSEDFAHEDLLIADSLQPRFIHRSAQDFLADSKQAAALLESCSMSRTEATTSLFAASVVAFLMRTRANEPGCPLAYAKSIKGKDWSASHTLLMDAYLTKLHCFYDDLTPKITSRKLSILENWIFQYLGQYSLAPYCHNRLQRLSINQVQDAIAISICLNPMRMPGAHSDDFTDVAVRYIQPNEELSLIYNVDSGRRLSYTCPLWQHAYVFCAQKSLYFRFREYGFKLARIRELMCFADISDIRCWIIKRPNYTSSFLWIPVTDNTMKAALDFFEDIEVWSVCISVDLYRTHEALKEVLKWSPSGCSHFFDIDDQDKAAFLQHLHARLEEGHLGSLISDPRVALLNRKLDILSLQEKAAIAWRSIRVHEFSLEDESGIYFEAGQFRTANRDENRESWEESVYEKSTCQEVEYDAETMEMVKCMLKDDKWYINGIRKRIEERKRQQSSPHEEESGS